MRIKLLNNTLFKGNTREINSMRNLIVGISFQIISLILNLFSKNAIIDALGVEYLGIQGLLSNIFVLLSFAEVGMSAVMTFNLYNPISQHDYVKISSLYSFFNKIYKIIALISMVVGLLCIFLLPYLNHSKLPNKDVVGYFLLYLAATVIYNLYILRTYIIIADQKKYIVSMAQIIFDGGSLAVGIAILYLTNNYTIFLANIILRNILFNWYMGRKVIKLYPYLNNKYKISEIDKNKIIRDVKDLLVYRLANVLLISTDNIFISVLIGTVYVGYYSNYQLLILGVVSLTSIIFDSVSASVGNYIVETDKERQYMIYKVIQVANMWITGFTTVCIYVLIQDFVYIWVGKDISLSMLIVVVLVINYYLDSIRLSTKVFREAAGLFRKIKWTVAIKALLNIILSIILGIYFGMIGIFIATAISILVTTFWYEPLLLHKTFFNRSTLYDLLIQIESIICVVICILITQYASSIINVSGWFTFFIKAIICGVVSNIFYIIILTFHKVEFKVLFNVVKNVLKHK